MYLESTSYSFDNSASEIDQWHMRLVPPGLQGHAIKNQDLLIASGSLSLKGQEGLSAVDDDLQVAVCASFDERIFDLIPHSSLSYKHRIISNQI